MATVGGSWYTVSRVRCTVNWDKAKYSAEKLEWSYTLLMDCEL